MLIVALHGFKVLARLIFLLLEELCKRSYRAGLSAMNSLQFVGLISPSLFKILTFYFEML
jgi:hypothetical protein